MSALLMAVLMSSAMVAANHFIPWMGLFRKGLPGLIIYGMHLCCLLIPITFMYMILGVMQYIDRPNVTMNPGLWIFAFWAVAVADLATELICYLIDHIITQRYRLEAAEDENDSLKADLSEGVSE